MDNLSEKGNTKNIIFSVILIVVLVVGVIFALSVSNSSSEKDFSKAETLANSYIEEIDKYMDRYEANYKSNPSLYPIKLEAGKTYRVEDINVIIGAGVVKPSAGVITIGEDNKVSSVDLIIDEQAISCINSSCNSISENEVLEAEKNTSTVKKSETKKKVTNTEETKKEETKEATKKEEPKQEAKKTTITSEPEETTPTKYRVTTLTCKQKGICSKTSKTCQKKTYYVVTTTTCHAPDILQVEPYTTTSTSEADTCTVEESFPCVKGYSGGNYDPNNPPPSVDGRSYISKCELKEKYEFSSESVTNNLSSCSNKSINCDASTVGQTDDSCNCPGATYRFESSAVNADSCSVGHSFNCSAATSGKSYVSNCQVLN